MLKERQIKERLKKKKGIVFKVFGERERCSLGGSVLGPTRLKLLSSYTRPARVKTLCTALAQCERKWRVEVEPTTVLLFQLSLDIVLYSET